MHAFCGSAAALAVASIYYAYRAYLQTQFRRQRTLRDRVAYMLWAATQSGDE
jgi:hypothetical protein